MPVCVCVCVCVLAVISDSTIAIRWYYFIKSPDLKQFLYMMMSFIMKKDDVLS